MFSRGQEAAVFELLIAVILMGFVILVGMSALQSLNEQKCEGELNQMLNDLKHAVELSSSGRSRQNVEVRFPSCFPPTKSILKLNSDLTEKECSFVCKEKRTDCIVLDFRSFDHVVTSDSSSSKKGIVFSKRVCLDMNPFTDFSGSIEDVSSTPNNYSLVSWSEDKPIVPGNYLLVNSSNFFSSTPSVNVYVYDPNKQGGS